MTVFYSAQCSCIIEFDDSTMNIITIINQTDGHTDNVGDAFIGSQVQMKNLDPNVSQAQLVLAFGQAYVTKYLAVKASL